MALILATMVCAVVAATSMPGDGVALRFRPTEGMVVRYRFSEVSEGRAGYHRVGLVETTFRADRSSAGQWTFTSRVPECEFLPSPLYEGEAIRQRMASSFLEAEQTGRVDEFGGLQALRWSAHGPAAVSPGGFQAYGPLGVAFPNDSVKVGDGWETQIDDRISADPRARAGRRAMNLRLVKLEGGSATIEWISRYELRILQSESDFLETGRAVVPAATGVPDQLLLRREVTNSSGTRTSLQVRLDRVP